MTLFKKSAWLWPESHFWNLHNGYALFRKEFALERVPKRALLHITADQSYQLYINGRYVCRGPARGFQKSWPYDTVDIAPFLTEGRNLIAVRAHNPGFGNFQYLSQGYAGLLVAGKIGTVTLISDSSWKSRRQSGVARNAVPSSVQLFCQEHIDLRVEHPGWMRPDFDDTSWISPATVPWNSMPWSGLEVRGIPLLEEKEITPAACLGVAEGENARDVSVTCDIAWTLRSEGLSHRPQSGSAQEILFSPTGSGRWRRVLIDFGQTVVGSLGLGISNARGGEIIDTLHVEKVEADLSTDYDFASYSREAFGQRIVCASGESEHVFYHAYGFRYLLLTVRNAETPLTIRPFLRTALYPLEVKGSFRSSDPDLDKIWRAAVRTQRCCCLDAYVDTPWREQAQWWGDARVQAWNTLHLANDPRLLRRGIAVLAGQRTPDGLTYGHAPTIAHHCILPDFSLIWLLTLWDHYWQTGSTEAFLAHQDAIADIFRYFRGSLDPKSGLASYDRRYWLFLDWTDIQREGCPTVLNLWLLIALERIAQLFVISKRPREAAPLRKWAASLRGSLKKLIGKDGLMRDGIDPRGQISSETSIHSQTLALMAGLRPESEAVMLKQVLLPFIREERKFKAKPSAYWITYIFSVLQERGYAKEVLAALRKGWLPMGEYGGTWESFTPQLGESRSHAWSAHPIYHFAQILGGIVQTAPAWKTIRYRPEFLIEACDVTLPSPAGLIRSRWEKRGNIIDVCLDLPESISATIHLPGKTVRTLRRSRRWKVPIR